MDLPPADPNPFTIQMVRRIRKPETAGARRRVETMKKIRVASITMLRGFANRRSWVQDVNAMFNRLWRMNPATTFVDALRAYADELQGNLQRVDIPMLPTA